MVANIAGVIVQVATAIAITRAGTVINRHLRLVPDNSFMPPVTISTNPANRSIKPTITCQLMASFIKKLKPKTIPAARPKVPKMIVIMAPSLGMRVNAQSVPVVAAMTITTRTKRHHELKQLIAKLTDEWAATSEEYERKQQEHEEAKKDLESELKRLSTGL